MTSVLTLPDAKTHLNITANTYDTELQTFIDAGEAAIGTLLGSPFGSTACDEWHDGGDYTLVALQAPVASVTSVTECAGTGYVKVLAEQPLDGPSDSFGYTLDKSTGLFTRRASGIAIRFLPGRRNIHLIYTAGYTNATVPADLLLADKEMLRHLWTTQRGAGTRRPGAETDSVPSTAYSFPNRVVELVAPHRRHGIA